MSEGEGLRTIEDIQRDELRATYRRELAAHYRAFFVGLCDLPSLERNIAKTNSKYWEVLNHLYGRPKDAPK